MSRHTDLVARELEADRGSPGVEETPPQGVSAFIARVLNQLTLSAWLPGAVLAAGLALLMQFREQHSLSLHDALAAIADEPLAVLVLAIPVLVIATLITQAFSFEAIRALEGYWRRRGPASWLRSVLTRLQLRRKRRLEERRRQSASTAFSKARGRLLDVEKNPTVILALEADATSRDRPEMTKACEDTADSRGWRALCDPWDLAEVDRCDGDLREYPIDSRLLPTRLGNVLRATEDRLVNAGGDVEGFALRRRSQAPSRVVLQHDQFRTRLDMYGTLVFVSGFLAATSPFMLAPLGWRSTLVVVGLFVVLAIVAYGAAISSARGYCVALKIMDGNLRETS